MARSTGWALTANPLDVDDQDAEVVERTGSGYRRAVSVDETLVEVDLATLQAASRLEERTSASMSANMRTSDPDLDDSEAWLEAARQQEERPTIPCPVDDNEEEIDNENTSIAIPSMMVVEEDPQDNVPTATAPIDYTRGLALDAMTLRAALKEAAEDSATTAIVDYREEQEEEQEDSAPTAMIDYRERLVLDPDDLAEAAMHQSQPRQSSEVVPKAAPTNKRSASSGIVPKAQTPVTSILEVAPGPELASYSPTLASVVAPTTTTPLPVSPIAPRVDLPPRPVSATLPTPQLRIATPPYDVEPMLRFLPPPVVRRAFISALQAQVPPPKRSMWITLSLVVFGFAIVGAAAVFVGAVLLSRW